MWKRSGIRKRGTRDEKREGQRNEEEKGKRKLAKGGMDEKNSSDIRRKRTE